MENSSSSGATVHLIHGYFATGKTTFAKQLAKETGAILFSFDEWYMKLFVGSVPTHFPIYLNATKK